MWLTTVFVVLFTLSMTSECRARIKTPKADPYSHLDDVVLELLTNCYGNRTSAIGLGGDTSDYLVKSLSSRKLVDVTLVTATSSNRERHPNLTPYQRLSVFVITSPLPEERQIVSPTLEILLAIIRSHWWNHQASFIIILKKEKGCFYSFANLQSFWTLGIINVNLICNHEGLPFPLMVTYNPYVKWAPKPWQPLGSWRIQKSDSEASVFFRWHQNNKEMCDQLNFDKTRNLGRWASSVYDPYQFSTLEYLKSFPRSTYFHMTQTRIHVISTLHRVMNATYKVAMQRKWSEFMDISAGIEPMKAPFMNVFSYPYRYIGSTFMSNFRGHKTQLEKILGVVDRSSHLAASLTLLITVMFFKFFAGQDFASAFLNVLRTICNVGFLHVPNTFPSQVFIATVLLFTVVMQGIFQGDLATLLTTAVPNRNINSMRDLVELGSNVYTWYPADSLFMPTLTGFKGSIISYNQEDPTVNQCYPMLQNDTSAVCLNHVNALLLAAELADVRTGKSLHVSDQIFQTLPYVQCWRNDWPLDIRANNILQRMFEADIVKPFAVRTRERSQSDPEFRYDKTVLSNKKVSVLTMKNLNFAFVILGIGHACATIVLIGEIVVSRVLSRKRTLRVRPFK